jgi:hypothetical protein
MTDVTLEMSSFSAPMRHITQKKIIALIHEKRFSLLMVNNRNLKIKPSNIMRKKEIYFPKTRRKFLDLIIQKLLKHTAFQAPS